MSLSYKFRNYFVNKSELIEKNDLLQEENDNLKLKLIGYDELVVENHELKGYLDVNLANGKILSVVLSKPPVSPYDTFIIDIGESQSIFIGNKVYASDSVIIGTIKNVTSRTSLVELFTNSGSKNEVILSRTGSSYVLSGHGGGNFVLDVPKDTDIIWGDTFIYPSSDRLVIGTVNYVDTNSQSSFKSIHIKSPINLHSLKRVLVDK
ncbi:MAG: rod shape-determining protein MreC [Minisyncoccia bacterium]